MQAMSFSFENMPVRTLGNPETPLFVAIDVVKALGFKDTINPIKRHVDPEDLIKVEIETAGGRQTVNAVNESVHYQTVYNALYDYFKIASYKDLRHDQMKAALALIETCTLKPQLPAPTLAEGSIILSDKDAEALLTFIYYVRFLFLNVFSKIYGILRIMDSPFAGKFWDAFNEVPWWRILEILAKHGHDINDMQCYQHWLAQQPKRTAA